MQFNLASVLTAGAAVLLCTIATRTPTNPTVPAHRSLFAQTSVSAPVARLLQRACADCHSNETVWPWYVHVPGVSALLVRDVDRAREHFNLSDWKRMKEKGPEELAAAYSGICENLLSGAMPKSRYLWMHPSARLSKPEVAEVCSWADKQQTELLRPSALAMPPRAVLPR